MCFYVLYFNLFTLSLNILFLVFYEVFIYMIDVEYVRVGQVAKLCVTHSETMYLTWTCEMRGSRIIQHRPLHVI
jgi:hypothetical protein